MAKKDQLSACIVCGTVLDGPIGTVMRVFGIHRSPQNPNVCNRCSTHLEEGSIVELTIFFEDMVGFTTMTNEIGSQRSYEIINVVFQKASDILIRHDAFIDKFIGDAVMAIFNIPIHRSDHVEQALAAAFDFQNSLPQLRQQFDRDLQFRVGMASGFAHVGHIGSQERKDYTAIGEVVNLASRLESAARPGEIILNDVAFRKISHLYPKAFLESIRVKGFEDEVLVARMKTAQSSTEAEESAPQIVIPHLKRKLSAGTILLGLLGAPCLGAAILGPLSIALGIGTLAASITPALVFLDQPAVQIPIQALAVVGALANLYAIWYGYRKRKSSPFMQSTLTRYERIKVSVITLISVAALLFICIELFIHFILGHHLGN